MALQTDGHSTRISFAAASSVLATLLIEKSVTPPGLSGGGSVDTTTMANTTYRTMQPKQLITMTNGSFTAAYDPGVLSDLVALLNVNTLITLTFPDATTWAFWGYLDEFTPNANEEGGQPTAEVTIVPTNQNDSGVETAPVEG